MIILVIKHLVRAESFHSIPALKTLVLKTFLYPGSLAVRKSTELVIWKNTFFDARHTDELLDNSLTARSFVINVLKRFNYMTQRLFDPFGSFAHFTRSVRWVLYGARKTSMCLRCVKAAYSSSISIQLQQKDSAEPPLIGRTVTEELRLPVEPRVHKVVAAAKKQQYAWKYYSKKKEKKTKTV